MNSVEFPEINVDKVKTSLLGEWADARLQVRELVKDEKFHNIPGMHYVEHRERVLEQVKLLADSGIVFKAFPKEYVGNLGDDFGGHVAGFEELFVSDPSLQIKSGVQFGLFAAAIQHLGTRTHHDKYLKDALNLQMLGCFGMTESGHGSDVFNIRTTATYSKDSDGFILNSPDRNAWKDYLGNAALHGRWAVVFAQLLTEDNVNHGVHAFLVPIRDVDGNFLPGVGGEDDGVKGGLNGIDNGRLHFSSVHIPRGNLLNKFGDVSDDGVYSSPIENEKRRFFIMLATLVQGRVSLDGAAVVAAKLGLQIAVTYANRRRQFTSAEHGGEEVLLMDYHEHQRRLIPLIAETYAASYAHEELLSEFEIVFKDMTSMTVVGEVDGMQELESHAAVLKALSTWHALNTLQQCREACGGNGFLAENRFTALRADFDIYVTFEGDNTVLLQLVGKRLLTEYSDRFKNMSNVEALRVIAGEGVSHVLKYKIADFSSGSVIKNLLQDRADIMVAEIAHDLLKARKSHSSMEAAFNADQSKLIEAAKAYGQWMRFVAFHRGIKALEDAASAETLTGLQQLFGVNVVRENLAWYVERGLLTPSQCKTVNIVFDELLASLRPHAQSFVDAFGYEPEHLRAAIIAD